VKKVAQSVAQTIFWVKINTKLHTVVGKSSANIWSSSVIFKKLPKVTNRQMEQKLPDSGRPVIVETETRQNFSLSEFLHMSAP
jgi:hypothetical protein